MNEEDHIDVGVLLFIAGVSLIIAVLGENNEISKL